MASWEYFIYSKSGKYSPEDIAKSLIKKGYEESITCKAVTKQDVIVDKFEFLGSEFEANINISEGTEGLMFSTGAGDEEAVKKLFNVFQRRDVDVVMTAKLSALDYKSYFEDAPLEADGKTFFSELKSEKEMMSQSHTPGKHFVNQEEFNTSTKFKDVRYHFYNCTFDDIRFSDSVVIGQLENCRFNRCTFENFDAENISFDNSVLTDCKIINSNFKNSNFEKAGIYHSQISASDFTNANLAAASIRHTRFDESNLSGVKFHGSTLDGVIITAATVDKPVEGLYAENITMGGATHQEIETRRNRIFSELKLEPVSFEQIAEQAKANLEPLPEFNQSDTQPISKQTVIVNCFAGPGAGKTTCAWEIASELKKRGIEAEYVGEYAKELVWDDNTELLDGSLQSQQQLYDVQNHRVQRLLGKVDVVVTDSPAILGNMYLKTPNTEFENKTIKDFKMQHNFNLFINRGNDFQQSGRIHNLEESKAIDNSIKAFLDKYDIYYGTYEHSTIDKVVDNIETHLKKANNNLSLSNNQIIDELKIYETSFEDGYMHFCVDADGYELEGLFRIYDPENGNSMEIVSIDYGDQHPIVSDQWSNIEKQCRASSLEKYSELIKQSNLQKQNTLLNEHKQLQFEIINKYNPAPNEYQTWIRTSDDIKSFDAALKDTDYAGWEQNGFDESYSAADAEFALKSGKITVYSSHPIKQGVFVTPSAMEARSYSGYGKIYSKEVYLDSVAWIDPTQGQYANVEEYKLLSPSELEVKFNGDYWSVVDKITQKDIELPAGYKPSEIFYIVAQDYPEYRAFINNNMDKLIDDVIKAEQAISDEAINVEHDRLSEAISQGGFGEDVADSDAYQKMQRLETRMNSNTQPPFDIPNIFDSLISDYNSGKITAEEIASELYKSGNSNYVPSEEEAIEKLYRYAKNFNVTPPMIKRPDHFGTVGYYSHPQYEIYDINFYGGNMHFKINTEDWQLGGVFRVYDPKNGAEMTLLGCDPDYSNYEQRSEIKERWGSIEEQCRNASLEKYKELSGRDFIFSNEEKITQTNILENKVMPEVPRLTLEEYLAQRGLASPVDDFMLDKLKLPHGQSKYDENKMHEDARKSSQEYHKKRNAAIQEYNAKVASGEIVEPTNLERYIKRASGNPDKASVQAARRVLEKRGYTQNEDGEWIKHYESETKLKQQITPFEIDITQKPITKDEFEQLTSEIKNIAQTYQADPSLISDYMAFKAQFYDYSPNNTLLIHLQNPHATFVASFTKWKKMGYSIKKGEHHIKISRPIEVSKFPRDVNGKTVWTDVKYATSDEKARIASGDLEIQKTKKFIPHQVFDISQTTCPPEDYPKIFSRGYESIEQAQLYECIKEYAKDCGFTVTEENMSSIALHGYYDKADDSIHINSTLNDSKKLETMAHELAHGVLHKTSTQPTEVKEFEAESFGTMLKRKLGFPVSEESKRYIKNYFSESKFVTKGKFNMDETLSRLSKAFKHTSTGIDKKIEEMGYGSSREQGRSLSQAKAQAVDPVKISSNFTQAL